MQAMSLLDTLYFGISEKTISEMSILATNWQKSNLIKTAINFPKEKYEKFIQKEKDWIKDIAEIWDIDKSYVQKHILN